MLLSLMRKHAKSWLIKFLIGIIAIVFIFYFGYSFTSKRALKVAYVNDDIITGLEYQKTYRDLLEALQRQYKSVWNDNLIKMFDLKNQALEKLINQKLISQEAKRLGFEVTEEEIQKAIMEYPAFKLNGRFDEGRYRSLLGHNRMKPEDFESSIAQDLLQEKLRQFLQVFLAVTDKELVDQYAYSNEKMDISYVQFKPDSFKESVQVDEAALEEYFKKNIESYRIPEKIKIAYIEIKPEDFKDQVAVKDNEIREYYEYNIAKYKKEKEVKARHILFKLNKNMKEDEVIKVREKAEAVLKDAREGKDFADLAKKHSEGPTKPKGGDLGYFTKGRMVKSFEEAAFGMKKGDISDLVKTDFGFHIIKVEDVKEAGTKSLEEVSEEIKKILIKNVGAEMAHEKGLSLIDQMPYDIDLAKYAEEHQLKVIYTDFFSQDQPIPKVGGSTKLRESIFSLQAKESSELIEQGSKFYIFQVVEKKKSFLPEIGEVFDKARKDFITHLAGEEAKSAAEAYLNKLKEGVDWNQLAEENKLKPQKTGFFIRRGSMPKIGSEPELQEMAFRLGEDNLYPDKIFQNDKGCYVIKWEAKKGFDEEKYKKEKDRYRSSMMQGKLVNTFQKWLEDLRNKAEVRIVTPVTD